MHILLILERHKFIEIWLLRHYFFIHKSIKRSLWLHRCIHRGLDFIKNFFHVYHTGMPLLVLLGWLYWLSNLCPLRKRLCFSLDIRTARRQFRRLRWAWFFWWFRVFWFVRVANHFLRTFAAARFAWNFCNCLVVEWTCLWLRYRLSLSRF